MAANPGQPEPSDGCTRAEPSDGCTRAGPSDDCTRVREQLGARLDDELSTSDCAVLETHLEGCEDCRRHDIWLREEWRLFRGMPEPVMDGPGGQEFLLAVRGRIQRQQRRTTWRFVLGSAAAAALVIATVFVVPWERFLPMPSDLVHLGELDSAVLEKLAEVAGIGEVGTRDELLLGTLVDLLAGVEDVRSEQEVGDLELLDYLSELEGERL